MEGKKKILIVSRSFYPDMSPRSYRTTELAKEFARQGHEITLLTIQREFDYTEFLKEYPINMKTLGKLRCKPFYRSNWKLIGDWRRKFGRLLFMLFNYPCIELMWRVKKALESEEQYNLMISVAVPYPVHWGTAWARNETHRIAEIWVADCGDPFMGNTSESFPIPFYFSYLEKWFSSKADYLTIPVEGAMAGYYPEFHHKMRIIPQGFCFEEKIKEPEIKENLKPTFAYAGGLAVLGLRSPVRFIRFLNSLEEDFEFNIFSTTGRDFLIPYIKESGGRIILHEPIPREELLPVLRKMDFLVNFDNGTTKQVPSKLIDYAIAGRPILNISPGQPEEKIILEFLEGKYENALAINNIEQYNIKNVARQFLDLL